MSKKIVAVTVLITMLLSFTNMLAAGAEKYSAPLIYPQYDTYIRKNAANQNFKDSGTLVVDNNDGSARMTFLSFSLSGYENYLKTGDKVYLRILTLADAAGDGFAFSVHPISGELKNIDLSTLTYNKATETATGEGTLVDYAPQGDVYSAKKYNWYNIDVTDYCLAQDDLIAVFMIRSIKGAFSFYSSESPRCEPSLVLRSGFTDLLNGNCDVAHYIEKLYNGMSASENVGFITEYNGRQITYSSESNGFIDSNGIICQRPANNTPDYSVNFTAMICQPEYPEYSEQAQFSVMVLKEGSVAAQEVLVSNDGIEISFSAVAPIADSNRILLQIDNTALEAGEEYSLFTTTYTGRSLVCKFVARTDTYNEIFDVTDFAESAIGSIGFAIADGSKYYETVRSPLLMTVPEAEAAVIIGMSVLDFGNLAMVTSPITLPLNIAGQDITWRSSDMSVISEDGRVERPDKDTLVDLTAVLDNGNYCYEKVFKAFVPRENSENGEEVFPELKDPMHLNDEELFGEWNDKINEWNVHPKLMYDKIPGLAAVEQSVKNREYENAKTLLLTYFRAKSGDNILTFDKINTYSITANALCDMLYGWTQMDSFIGEITVGSEWNWYTIDITADDPSPKGAYWMIDSDMDGSHVEIASKENTNGCSAYLEVVSNGARKIYPVSDDTYMSAGANSETVYSNEEVLYCREEAADAEIPFCEDTARPYFGFPVNNIDGATSVKFTFYGRSVGKSSKKLYFLTTRDCRNFKEDELYWSMHTPHIFNFKNTGYIWKTRESFHQAVWKTNMEWTGFSARLYQCRTLLQRYAATQNEKFAYYALEAVISLYTQQPYADYPNVLAGGWRIESLISALYDSINSKHMTPEILTAFLKYIYTHGEGFQNTVVEHAANWNSAIQVNLARICAFVPEITQGGWWENVRQKLYDFYKNDTTNTDGSYTESTSAYIASVMAEFDDAIKITRTVEGDDSEYYKLFSDMYKALATYYMNLAYANGKTVPYGDGGRGSIRNTIKEYCNFLYDGNLDYFAGEGESGTKPAYTSILYPAKAVAMLRSGWYKDDLCAFMSNDNGGSHAHRDDLALDVTAYDKYLLVDPGTGAYSETSEFAQRRFDTLYHNTVEIDNTNQIMYAKNSPGRMELKTNDSFDLLDAGNTSIYPGFNVNRKVLLLKNKYIIVSDYIYAPEGPHTYRQIWHPDEGSNVKIKEETGMAYTAFGTGANIKIMPADPQKCKPMLFQRVNSSNEKVTSVQYAAENVEGNWCFDTVLYPEKSGESSYILVDRLELDKVEQIDATALKITIDGNVGQYYSSNENTYSERTFGNYSYNGESAYVETDDDGVIQYIAMTDGSELKKGETSLVSSVNGLKDLSIKLEGEMVYLYSSEALPECGIKVLAPSKINKVYFNGTEIEMSVLNGYIYTKGEKKAESGYEGIKPGASGGQGKSGSDVTFGGASSEPDIKTPEVEPVFSDMNGHWAQSFVEELYKKGILAGDGSGSFKPDNCITRAEFIKLVVAAAGLDIGVDGDCPFVDVKDGDWCMPYVKAAYFAGFIDGYEDGTFRPDANITRQEMAKLLAGVLKYSLLKFEIKADTTGFKDEGQIASWAYDYVLTMTSAGLFEGNEQGYFNPEKNATRAEAATVIYKLLLKIEKKGE